MLDLARPWRSYDVASCDFEATSADPLTCEPVEVSCVRFDENGALVDKFTSLLRTKVPIPAESTAIHGITDEMVKDAPALEEVAPELAKIAADAVPLAFNRGYDRTLLHRYLSGEGVPLFDPAQPWLCALAMAWSADRFEPGKGRHKLAACCERRGIRIVGAHRAEADAIMCGTLFFALMAETKAETTMAQVLARVDKRETEREADRAAWLKKCRAEDRPIWRQYACAALAGSMATGHWSAHDAADVADAMLALEKGKVPVTTARVDSVSEGYARSCA